jgi:hypothetical protein
VKSNEGADDVPAHAGPARDRGLRAWWWVLGVLSCGYALASGAYGYSMAALYAPDVWRVMVRAADPQPVGFMLLSYFLMPGLVGAANVLLPIGCVAKATGRSGRRWFAAYVVAQVAFVFTHAVLATFLQLEGPLLVLDASGGPAYLMDGWSDWFRWLPMLLLSLPAPLVAIVALCGRWMRGGPDRLA